jgi:hypothetical protein
MKMMNDIQQTKIKSFSDDNQNFLIDFYIESRTKKESNLNKFNIK